MKNNKGIVRRIFGELHLWLGVASGLVLFVICLSGTVYTFRSEFEQLGDPGKYMVEKTELAARMNVDRIIANLADSGQVSSLLLPHMEERTIEVVVKTSPEQRRGTVFYINPYSGEIAGKSGGKVSEFFFWVMRLHRWLLMGKTGKVIVGTATLIFVLLIFSGLVIWFPKKLRNLKNGLRLTFQGNWKRTNWELHNVLGFYAAPVLLIMAFTGLSWSFDWYRTGLGNVLGTPVFNRGGGEKTVVAVPADSTRTQTSVFFEKARKEWSGDADFRVSFGRSATDPVTITKFNTGLFAFAGTDNMEFNPYTADVLAINRFSDKPFNEKITSLIKPLHTGEIYGTFSKILYFFVALLATSLPVTGIFIWIQKLRWQHSRKKG